MLTQLLSESSAGPVIIWVMYPHTGNEIENTLDAINKICGEGMCTIIAVVVDDWNGNLSPWIAEGIDTSFSGEAGKTLEYIRKNVIPDIKESQKDRTIYIMGYSLAGLFALWTLYQTDIFAGAISCSGSFWYPDFAGYIEDNEMSGKKIYISLGGRESKTSNKIMATIEENTRKIADILKKNNDVKFELNPGGHFADSGKRLAKGVRFVLSTQRRCLYEGSDS